MDHHHQISEDLVRKELTLILEFDEIKNSPVLARFIQFVVDKNVPFSSPKMFVIPEKKFVTFRCSIITPLGFPVEPEVYIT